MEYFKPRTRYCWLTGHSTFNQAHTTPETVYRNQWRTFREEAALRKQYAREKGISVNVFGEFDPRTEADFRKWTNQNRGTMRACDFIPGEVYRFPGKATRYLCKRIHKGREVFFQVIDEQGTPVQTRDEWSGEIISNGMVSFQADLAKMRIEE